jgi:hypothetical protein
MQAVQGWHRTLRATLILAAWSLGAFAWLTVFDAHNQTVEVAALLSAGVFGVGVVVLAVLSRCARELPARWIGTMSAIAAFAMVMSAVAAYVLY